MNCKNFKRFLSLMLCLTLIAGMAAGCGNKPATPPADTSAPAGSKSDAPVEYKKDIILGLSGKHSSIDPHANSNTQHNYMFRMVFDNLVDYDNATGKILPCLATSWEVDKGLTYTFKLRSDVKFHNGEPLKASDVVFTFKRAVGTTSSNAMATKIASVEALDDYTVKMVLTAPNFDWLHMMTLPTAVVLSEKACTSDPVEGPGVGSGPWKIDSYKFGDFTKLVKNDNFWGEKAKGETFTFRYIPEASARLIALQTGEIDICADPDKLELGYITDDSKLELQSWKGSSLNYLAFNTQKGPASNKDFRKAISHGIKFDDLIAVSIDGKGERALSFWGWNEFGYNGGKTAPEYNPTKAKEYLAKAYPNGGATLEISISGAERKSNAELIQAQLKEIGVTVTIKELDSAGISTSTTDGEHQSCIYGMGFNTFGDDARRILQPGSAVNKAHFKNDRVMELLDLAVAEVDEAKRKTYYEEIQQIVYDEAAYVPLYFSTGYFGVKKGVGGIDYYPTSHHDMSNVYVPLSK